MRYDQSLNINKLFQNFVYSYIIAPSRRIAITINLVFKFLPTHDSYFLTLIFFMEMQWEPHSKYAEVVSIYESVIN